MVVDCESGPVRLGLAGELARELGGSAVTLDELRADSIAGLVKDVPGNFEEGRLMPQGQAGVVPEDGLTTRQRRNRPLVMVHTGVGKGKSTAAFGLALRAWNQGWPIGVFQFVKSAKWKVGEENALKVLGASGEGGTVDWHKMGEGWSWVQREPAEGEPTTRRRPARAGSRSSATWRPRRTSSTCSTSSPTRCTGAGSTSTRWSRCCATVPAPSTWSSPGRNAPEQLVEFADLVTDMTKVKHPMDAGQKGQRGIEW